MSKSRDRKTARLQARQQRQQQMATANYEPTGKSKYALKRSRKPTANSPFRVVEEAGVGE